MKNQKRGVAPTSKESFAQERTQTKRINNAHRILNYLSENDFQTSRGMAKVLSIERSTITKPILDLLEAEKIIIGKIEKCPETKHRVYWYCLNPEPEAVASAA